MLGVINHVSRDARVAAIEGGQAQRVDHAEPGAQGQLGGRGVRLASREAHMGVLRAFSDARRQAATENIVAGAALAAAGVALAYASESSPVGMGTAVGLMVGGVFLADRGFARYHRVDADQTLVQGFAALMDQPD